MELGGKPPVIGELMIGDEDIPTFPFLLKAFPCEFGEPCGGIRLC